MISALMIFRPVAPNGSSKMSAAIVLDLQTPS